MNIKYLIAKPWTQRGISLCLISLFFWVIPAFGQEYDPGENDDYGVFATDPLEIDREVKDLYGRYFQTTFGIGSLMPTGDLGAIYSPGYILNLKFILYLDRVWAWEIAGGFSKLSGAYTDANTNRVGVDIKLNQTIIPFETGVRYGFDLDALPQFIAMMNPYISAGPGVAFRSESTVGTPTTTGLETEEANLFLKSSTRNTTGWILHAGTGLEFNILESKILVGFDARYHAVIWSDSALFVGDAGRKGHFLTIMGTMTYNY